LLPLSQRVVKGVHEVLMQGVRGQNKSPGEYRRIANWIGAPGCTIEQARFVPASAERVADAMSAWENYLHSSVPDLLVQLAILHAEFEAIHPFLDGNGRLGRLLITLFLVERGRLSQPLLYLSDYLESHRDEYYARLQRVRTDGDWNGWLGYFLAGVNLTARKAVRQAAQLMDLRERLRRRLVARPRALLLVDELFKNPYVDVARAKKALGVTHPTARQVIRVLEEEGILKEVTGRRWGRLFLARPILKAIEEPAPER